MHHTIHGVHACQQHKQHATQQQLNMHVCIHSHKMDTRLIMFGARCDGRVHDSPSISYACSCEVSTGSVRFNGPPAKPWNRTQASNYPSSLVTPVEPVYYLEMHAREEGRETYPLAGCIPHVLHRAFAAGSACQCACFVQGWRMGSAGMSSIPYLTIDLQLKTQFVRS
jgi:hypothetical protein